MSQLLTARGGKYELPEHVQAMMALTSDGKLFVSKSHEKNLLVLNFISRLKRHNEAFSQYLVDFSHIQAMYQNGAAGVTGDTYYQRWVVSMIKEAVSKGASDIHIEVKPTHTQVECRVHGELRPLHEWSREEGQKLCKTLFHTMTDIPETIFDAKKSQGARLAREFVQECQLFGARIATRPTVGEGCFWMVMRLLYDNGKVKRSLADLGFLPEQITLLRRMRYKVPGIRISSGVTGSGKSTLLQTMMDELVTDRPTLRVATFEDPPEYEIRRAIQTPVTYQVNEMDDPEKTISFAWTRAIATAMRMDPDVMMIGEIRDAASAKAAVEAARTGHGVWTTLHAKDVMMLFDRLGELGVDSSALFDASLMSGLINQELVRALCPACKVPWITVEPTLQKEWLDYLSLLPGLNREAAYGRGEGCDACQHSGLSGRTVVAEILVPDHRFMSILRTEGKEAARAYWINDLNGIPKASHLMRLVNQGRVDPRDAADSLDV